MCCPPLLLKSLQLRFRTRLHHQNVFPPVADVPDAEIDAMLLDDSKPLVAPTAAEYREFTAVLKKPACVKRPAHAPIRLDATSDEVRRKRLYSKGYHSIVDAAKKNGMFKKDPKSTKLKARAEGMNVLRENGL